jgi:hypothetical protein
MILLPSMYIMFICIAQRGWGHHARDIIIGLQQQGFLVDAFTYTAAMSSLIKYNFECIHILILVLYLLRHFLIFDHRSCRFIEAIEVYHRMSLHHLPRDRVARVCYARALGGKITPIHI